MKKTLLDTNGLPIAFYCDEIHGTDIPPGTVEITDEQWQECIDNQGRRRIVVVNGAATVEPYTPPLPPATERRASAKAAIDQAAGRARLRYASPGDMIAQEYREAEVDAQAFKDAGYVGAVPATVQSWASATGNTAAWAADDILAAGQNLRTVLASVRDKRLNGKAAVDAALDADIESTAATYVAQLDAMVPA